MRHEFFTLYGHLSRETLRHIRVGQVIKRGEKFARIGALQENGGWPPHLHFQMILDLLDRGTDFPGVALASQRAVWTTLSPDPNLLLGVPAAKLGAQESSAQETLAARRSVLGSNLSVSYRRPLKIVRGWMQYLYDDTGRAFLDVYNNVPLVGHSHPRVVRAAQEQLAVLNTNTRYLHDNVVRYADRLTKLMPEPLRVCYLLNSGSEANELALRLARAHTGREDIIVLEHAYHGNTNTLIDISPYKFNGPGGRGQKPWVHVAPIPDDYRALYRRGDPEAGAKYARFVGEIIERARGEKREIAAFIAETLPSVAGQIVFPSHYLAEAYRYVRAAGGVCIADEVQVGFGRLGTHFWGFETQGVVPDIVVLGKPIGNAFPLAAVVTTPEIAASFANGMEFFSTFGGQSGRVCCWACRSGCAGRREVAAERAEGWWPLVRRAEINAEAVSTDRRRAWIWIVSGDRPGSRWHLARTCYRRGRLRRQPSARTRHFGWDRRPVSQRDQAAPAPDVFGSGRQIFLHDTGVDSERGRSAADSRLVASPRDLASRNPTVDPAHPTRYVCTLQVVPTFTLPDEGAPRNRSHGGCPFIFLLFADGAILRAYRYRAIQSAAPPGHCDSCVQ